MLRVLGIDPGIDTTGYGVVEYEADRYRLIEYGAVQTQARLAFSTRLALDYRSDCRSH